MIVFIYSLKNKIYSLIIFISSLIVLFFFDSYIYSLKNKIYSSSRCMYLITCNQIHTHFFCQRHETCITSFFSLCFKQCNAYSQNPCGDSFYFLYDNFIYLLKNKIYSSSRCMVQSGNPCGDSYIYSLIIFISYLIILFIH